MRESYDMRALEMKEGQQFSVLEMFKKKSSSNVSLCKMSSRYMSLIQCYKI